MNLNTVAEALNRLIPADCAQLSLTEVREAIEIEPQGYAQFVIDEDHLANSREITTDILYGQYLHGDYARWERSRRVHPVFEETAISSWAVAVERLVYDLERVARSLVDSGQIDLDGEG